MQREAILYFCYNNYRAELKPFRAIQKKKKYTGIKMLLLNALNNKISNMANFSKHNSNANYCAVQKHHCIASARARTHRP